MAVPNGVVKAASAAGPQAPGITALKRVLRTGGGARVGLGAAARGWPDRTR